VEEKSAREPQTPAPAPVKAEAEEKNPAGLDEKAERITAFLTGLMEHMQVKAVPVVERGEEGTYKVNLEGENLGPIIGRRGETLDAIQQLTSYSVNRGAAKRVRIQVDAEHYRAKREETLIRLANRVADKVVKYRRNVTLEPMNAYERHVIHAALQDYDPAISTYSTGTEPNRRIVVAFDRNA
jgi:spoIIIJ-associated protein